MDRCEFYRVEAFANSASKLSSDARSAAEIVEELNRLPAACRHVPIPKPPFMVYGSTQGLLESLDGGLRKDTPVLIGAVASWPDRWDMVNPEELVEWISREADYAHRAPGVLAAIALHLDEAYPHLHILKHMIGASVKAIHAGFAAGDSAHAAALAEGCGAHDANQIRLAEHQRGKKAQKHHHYQNVGAPSGLKPASDNPRKRDARQAAVKRQEEHERLHPVDHVQAEANKAGVKRLLLLRGPSVAPPGKKAAEILQMIGFEPKTNFKEYAAEIAASKEPIKVTTNRTRLHLQAKLGEILDAKPRLRDFVLQCKKAGIVPIFRVTGEDVTGVSFRYDGRVASGTSLGSRFAWPALRRVLRFDAVEDAPVVRECGKLAAHLDSYYTCEVEPDDGIVLQDRIRRGRKLPRDLKKVEGSGSIEYRWKKLGRTAMRDHLIRLSVLDPVRDIFELAVREAARRSWKKIRITAPRSIVAGVSGALMRLGEKLGVAIRFVVKEVVEAVREVVAAYEKAISPTLEAPIQKKAPAPPAATGGFMLRPAPDRPRIAAPPASATPAARGVAGAVASPPSGVLAGNAASTSKAITSAPRPTSVPPKAAVAHQPAQAALRGRASVGRTPAALFLPELEAVRDAFQEWREKASHLADQGEDVRVAGETGGQQDVIGEHDTSPVPTRKRPKT